MPITAAAEDEGEVTEDGPVPIATGAADEAAGEEAGMSIEPRRRGLGEAADEPEGDSFFVPL